MLDENLGIYSLADYNYDGKNNAGVLSLLSRFGIGTPLIQNDTTVFTLSLGPSMQWMNGGSQCGKDPYCGNSYAGAVLINDLSWKPNKLLKLKLNNKLSTAFTPTLKPGNSFIAKLKVYPSIYSNYSRLFNTPRRTKA